MKKNAILALMLLFPASTSVMAQDKGADEAAQPVNIHGTIRSKYEYQTEEGEGRFEVRNA